VSPIELDDTPRQNLAQPRRQLSFGRSAKLREGTSVRVRNTPRDGVFSGGGPEKGRFPTSTFLTSVSGLLVLVFPPPSTGTRLQTCLPATTSWNPSSGARRLTSAPSHRCCVSAD
jgi:hypothetical protein